MPMPPTIQYARQRVLVLTWEDDDHNAIDLTGATITGIIERSGVQTAITGTLALVTAASGIFSWTYSAADVAQAGAFFVQFRAKFSGSLSEFSYRHKWQVLPSFAFELVSASTSPSGSSSPSASPSPSS